MGRRHGVCKSPVDTAWTVPSSSAPSEGVTAGLVSGSCVGSAALALHGCAVHREWTRGYASAVVSIHLPQSAFMRRCFMSLASVAHCTAHRCLPCPWPPPSPHHPLTPSPPHPPVPYRLLRVAGQWPHGRRLHAAQPKVSEPCSAVSEHCSLSRAVQRSAAHPCSLAGPLGRCQALCASPVGVRRTGSEARVRCVPRRVCCRKLAPLVISSQAASSSGCETLLLAWGGWWPHARLAGHTNRMLSQTVYARP